MSENRPYLDIPGEKSRALLARRQEFVARGVSSAMNIFAAKADGAIIEDVDGNRYIDFAGGIGAMNAGHARPEVTRAIAEQAAKFTHTCFSVMMYEPYIELAERIVKLTPGEFPKKAIFFNSGAEAVENAVKIARYATGRPAIISFDNAFHGRTLMTMTMTSKVKPYKYRFGPFAPEVYQAPFPYAYRMDMTPQQASEYCIAELESMFVGEVAPDQVAAIIIEPVQGEGGFMVAPPGFLSSLKEVCQKYGILFVADEIQSGFCRTGRMFAVEHDGVEPDMIIIAKSMGAGMPISGVVGRAEVMDTPLPGMLGGTYIVGDVRGLGGMVAMELVKNRTTKEPDSHAASDILAAAHHHGLVLIKAGMYDNVIRVLVPLCVTDEQLQQGLDILEAACATVAQVADATTTV